jgi:quinol monooxygenase YgiN
MGWAEPSRIGPAATPRPRSVCAVFHAEASPGADEECEALIGDLAREIRTREPGCESYIVTRAMGSRSKFVMHARFMDWSAFEDHAATAHMSRVMPKLSALLAAPLSMELYLEI